MRNSRALNLNHALTTLSKLYLIRSSYKIYFTYKERGIFKTSDAYLHFAVVSFMHFVIGASPSMDVHFGLSRHCTLCHSGKVQY